MEADSTKSDTDSDYEHAQEMSCGKKGKQMVFYGRVYIFIQLMYNKNDHLEKQSIFVRCLIFCLLWLLQHLSPLDQRRPLYMLYTFITKCHCPNGILGLGGKATKNKLKDTSFTFPVTNVTILSIFCTHAQKGYC